MLMIETLWYDYDYDVDGIVATLDRFIQVFRLSLRI